MTLICCVVFVVVTGTRTLMITLYYSFNSDRVELPNKDINADTGALIITAFVTLSLHYSALNLVNGPSIPLQFVSDTLLTFGLQIIYLSYCKKLCIQFSYVIFCKLAYSI